MLPVAPPEGASAFVPAQRSHGQWPASSDQVLLALPATAATASVVRSLRADGLDVASVHDGIGVLDAARARVPALVVVDVELPGPDVVTVVGALQAEVPSAPLVAVTPRERRAALLGLLRADRDDYVLRPFPVDELSARIRLRLRQGGLVEEKVVRIGDLAVDPDLGEVQVDGRPVALSPTEFALLMALLTDAGQTVSHDEIARRVWAEPASANLVQVYISYVRRKIGAERIRTVRGAGYVLEG
ncbi:MULTISPECIES: response regulator transcription factor [Pseudonocardia]|jgi:two-component system response regulator QseB|uniref:Two component transcriptional regulator, winged helix family n=1 Tax=Pseudonocardia dioxanivorans (strain ATCC 55486 / DSM 44775 / JCM 13855 / CB1190) TaxID=675635 RepID=F4CM20_PSEUX|nr:response regulator transcription factor [Pseudonocardia dioxanivorans]AEA22507.1 two component transcriptional regulator, winged helix family [Pseudonocardia dioxanivorans CB1190]GJF01378.1 DNA-binding response regulator [Pseudonocardia sp. D17]